MKQSPQVEWPLEWGVPSRRALSFSRSRVPALILGALVSALVAAAVSRGLGNWAAVFAFGMAWNALLLLVAPRPHALDAAGFAGLYSWFFSGQWQQDPAAAVQSIQVILVSVAATVLLLPLFARLLGRGQLIRFMGLSRPGLRLSPDGVNWGAGVDKRVAWSAITSVDPVPLNDRSLGDVSGVCRVIVRGERDGLLDLHEMNYGPAATLYLLRHYLAHPEDRVELGWGWRFDLRARRAARTRLTYPQAQLQDVAR